MKSLLAIDFSSTFLILVKDQRRFKQRQFVWNKVGGWDTHNAIFVKKNLYTKYTFWVTILNAIQKNTYSSDTFLLFLPEYCVISGWTSLNNYFYFFYFDYAQH